MENTFKTSASQTGEEMNREQLTAAGAGFIPVTVPPAVAQNTHLSFASPPPRPYPSAEGATGNTQLSFTSPPPSPYPSAEGASVTGAQNRRLSFDSPPPRPYPSAEGVTGTGAALSNVNVNSSEKMTNKRGRPRKNSPDGIAVGLTAAASASAAVTPPQEAVSSAAAQPVSEGGPSKKPRGRPPGSCKKQRRRRTFGSAGSGITFKPHVIVAEKGEDVARKIVSFTRQGSRSVNIISANGVVSKVVLVRSATTDETVTHEGQLDILSLSGSFKETIIGDEDSWTGAITISVVREGLVFGGSVIGDLTAASTVQIILATNVEESERVNSPPANSPPANSPPAGGTVSESSGRSGSPLNHGDSDNANMQGMPNMP